jgi:P27 family predicted phage terminase small subunit
MRGRKPIPTALKLLHGTRKDRILPDEPKVDPGMPLCPDFIQGEGREQWNVVGPQLVALGIMTQVDGVGLAMLANATARWMAAEVKVQQMGEVLQSDEGGYYQNPYLAVSNKAFEQMNRMLVEFGMTPASRTRVSAAKQTKSSVSKRKRA